MELPGGTWRSLEEQPGGTWRNWRNLEESTKYKQLKQSKLNILHMRARKQVIFKHALGQHGEHTLICCVVLQSVEALKKH